MRRKLLFEARDFMEANMSIGAPEKIWLSGKIYYCVYHEPSNGGVSRIEYIRADIAEAQLAAAEKSVELMHQACSKASSEYLQLRRKFLAAEKREAVIIKELEKLKKKCLDAGIEI